jgi:hypothetical protein
LLALALAIFAWGTAYKLSLYHAHLNHTVRVSEARLWLDTRSARSVTDRARRVFAERPPSPSNVHAAEHQRFLTDLGAVEKDYPRLPSLASFISLLPSRSPPLRRFCLA